MLDVVRTLLAENDRDAVLEIVSKLVAENADMSRRLAQVKRAFKTSEKIGRAQLVLFADALARGEGEPEADEEAADGPDELDEADARSSSSGRPARTARDRGHISLARCRRIR